MNKYFTAFMQWYDSRNMREKLLTLALACAFVYAIFSLTLFQPLDAKLKIVRTDITEMRSQIDNWKVQTDAIKKIPQSPLYKEWLAQSQSLHQLQAQYKALLHTPPTKQWQDIIATLLQSQSNISLVQIKNFPEADYNLTTVGKIKTKIFQQKLSIIVYGNYFDTVQFLERLEKTLPSLHWDSLKYEVAQYPIAKVEMEFSIIYEKA